jgi:hypothetical protein
LDIKWLRDESLEDLGNLPPHDAMAQEIIGDLEAASAASFQRSHENSSLESDNFIDSATSRHCEGTMQRWKVAICSAT